MAIKLTIKHKGKYVTINVGDILTLNEQGETANLGTKGDMARVLSIYSCRHLPDSKLQIVRNTPHIAWCNLSGQLPSPAGLDLFVGDVLVYFDFGVPLEDVYISKNFTFKNRNLKGLDCKYLAAFRGGDCFVEFEEDIGGCSCDGLGRAGHCIIINRGFLMEKEGKRRDKSSSKHFEVNLGTSVCADKKED